jgi:hypothetical protein
MQVVLNKVIGHQKEAMSMHLPARKMNSKMGVSEWRGTNSASVSVRMRKAMYSGYMFSRPGTWDEEGG